MSFGLFVFGLAVSAAVVGKSVGSAVVGASVPFGLGIVLGVTLGGGSDQSAKSADSSSLGDTSRVDSLDKGFQE